MPNPNKYKQKSKWMRDCMHQNMHVEKKDRDQSVAICLNRWKQKGSKRCLSNILKNIYASIIEGKYIKEKEKGIPGQPGYKPPLWYWITSEGKKMLVDQKSME